VSSLLIKATRYKVIVVANLAIAVAFLGVERVARSAIVHERWQPRHPLERGQARGRCFSRHCRSIPW
jgi:hypothetical protein